MIAALWRSDDPGLTLIKIIACSVWMLLASSVLGGELGVPEAPPAAQRLELPKMTDLEIPPIGPPLAEPRVPPAFFGCWMGTPRYFDAVASASATNATYKLSRVTKCYLPSRIETREFALERSPKHRFFNAVLSFLGLASHHVQIRAQKTEIYQIIADQVYSRGTLTVEFTEGSLFQFPRSSLETIVDEEVATLVDPDTLSIVGRVFVTGAGTRSVGTWRADFHH
jgi:hypothetical protein